MHHAFSFLISIHLMLLFIRMAAVGGERSIVFQYISCYCLSVSGFDSFISAHLFQYISCYCLSGLSLGLFNDQADFNTSHVTVYPCCTSEKSLVQLHFNTSHVTVYLPVLPTEISTPQISIHLMLLFIQLPSTLSDSSSVISIHLMLLFIWLIPVRTVIIVAFQYISCYCLSNELTPFYIFLRI